MNITLLMVSYFRKRVEKREKATWWSESVAVPLGNYLKKHFGEKKKCILISGKRWCNSCSNRAPDKDQRSCFKYQFFEREQEHLISCR